MRSILTIFFAALICSSITSRGQGPTSILVMLKSGNSKIEYFEKRRDKKSIDLVRNDANEAMKAMINDFTDNFQYCPVYYFIDTNLQLIKDKKFDGVLFDKDRKVYTTSPIKTTDSSFFIVYYGHPPVEIRTGKNGEQSYTSKSYPGRGLTVLDHQYKPLRRPKILYVYEPEISELVRGKDPKYNYSSKNFDIGYKQLAKILQNTIKTHD